MARQRDPDLRDESYTERIDRYAEPWGQIRMAHEAVMVDDLANTLRDNRRRTNHGGELPEDQKDSDMGVQLGDNVVHNHYSTPPPNTPRRSSNGNMGWKIAGTIGAALAIGETVYLLTSGDTPTPPPPADTNTEYELRILDSNLELVPIEE